MVAASSSGFSSLYLSPVSINATAGKSFTVNVMLSLVAGQNVSGFDIKLNYSNPQSGLLIKADNLFYSGNIFGDAQSNFVSTECVAQSSAPSIGCQTSDPTDVEVGWVHFSALANSGNPVAGPLTALLFSVEFQVYGTGSSLIHINTANVGNTGSGPYGVPQFIPITTQDAIFSNSGIVAFFNYVSTDTPSVVSQHVNIFNATGTFNADNRSIVITSYAWNFGDGSTTKNVTTPTISHTFNTTGSFYVTLKVVDAKGNPGLTYRIVAVGPPVGALLLAVFSLQKVQQSGVLVQIFNVSATHPFGNATTDSSGQVTFRNLTPGTYTLAFSGPYVKNSTATETVIAGWTTQDSVGIEVDTPPLPGPTPWYGGVVFLGSLGAAIGLFGFGLFVRRRNARKKLRATRVNTKK